MENPNSRPYTAEELEALITEEAHSSDISKNNKVGKARQGDVILENNQPAANKVAAIENGAITKTIEASKLKKYAPYIILGVVVISVGIYLYYDCRKRKEAEEAQKPNQG